MLTSRNNEYNQYATERSASLSMDFPTVRLKSYCSGPLTSPVVNIKRSRTMLKRSLPFYDHTHFH